MRIWDCDSLQSPSEGPAAAYAAWSIRNSWPREGHMKGSVSYDNADAAEF